LKETLNSQANPLLSSNLFQISLNHFPILKVFSTIITKNHDVVHCIYVHFHLYCETHLRKIHTWLQIYEHNRFYEQQPKRQIHMTPEQEAEDIKLCEQEEKEAEEHHAKILAEKCPKCTEKCE
jgi:hypothetical protein